MKKPIIPIALLVLALLTGCSAARTIDRAEDHPEDRIENKIEQSIVTLVTPIPDEKLPVSPTPNQITEVEAMEIALAHAGLTAEQVQYIHTEFEIDNRIPEYTVDFFANGLEYEYEIHAESGNILSYDVDR